MLGENINITVAECMKPAIFFLFLILYLVICLYKKQVNILKKMFLLEKMLDLSSHKNTVKA